MLTSRLGQLRVAGAAPTQLACRIGDDIGRGHSGRHEVFGDKPDQDSFPGMLRPHDHHRATPKAISDAECKLTERVGVEVPDVSHH
jgi:hypothetical protein